MWEASIPCESLWGWKKILLMRGDPRFLLKLIVGNGESIFAWHEDEPLVQQYGNSYRIVYDSNKGCFGVKMSCMLFVLFLYFMENPYHYFLFLLFA